MQTQKLELEFPKLDSSNPSCATLFIRVFHSSFHITAKINAITDFNFLFILFLSIAFAKISLQTVSHCSMSSKGLKSMLIDSTTNIAPTCVLELSSDLSDNKIDASVSAKQSPRKKQKEGQTKDNNANETNMNLLQEINKIINNSSHIIEINTKNTKSTQSSNKHEKEMHDIYTQ